GQRAPEFSLPDSEKKTRALGEFTKQGTVILAFFPFAFSGVCDKEMCTFRDGFGELQGAKAQLVGVSVDSSYSLKAFSQTYNLQFPLLSDFNKKVVRLYGVLQDPWVGLGYKGVAKRSTFVIDRKGILRHRWVTDVPSEEPPYAEVVKAAQKLAS
ncbi:MAG TPA: redoxin domain-containing protein, partial [Nitrososphaerales archaeon]|nr:redoxin domain-containing protein [Nitrososphaerales archaeon]